ncbi:MAG: outer membrane protein assembly factor BamB family protein [Planctomycetota bacterium]
MDRCFLTGGLAFLLLSTLAVLYWMAGPGGETEPAPPPAHETAWRPPAGVSWPVFRGDRAFRGVSDDPLVLPLHRLWEFRTESSVRSSPVIGDGRIFVGSDDGRVYALDLADGSKVWAFDAGAAVEAPPLLVEGGVYVGNEDGTFFALAATDGTLRWKGVTEGKIVGSANWIRDEKENSLKILVGSHDNLLRCYAAETGKEAWRFPTESYINGAPALVRGIAVFGGCDARVYEVDGLAGKEVRSVDAGSYIAASAAVEGDRAYVGHYDNELICIDLVKGTVVWRYAGKGEGAFFASPAVRGDRVVTGCRDGRVHCVRSRDGGVLWTFDTKGDVDASPVIAGDKVVAPSTDGTLYVLSLEDGRRLWSFPVGASILGSPAVAGGMVIVGAEDGKVYAFGPEQSKERRR